MIKFIHMRMHNDKGSIEAKGGITVAFNIEDNKVFYALAKCHDDNYNKAYGRAKAGGRIKASDVNFVVYEKLPKTSEIVDHIKQMVYYEEEKYWPDVRNYLY